MYGLYCKIINLQIKKKIMSNKTGIGYSPISDRVYLGKQNPTKSMWTGTKEDITSDFIGVALAYFEVNTIREIGCSDTSSNLVINIKHDKAGLKRIINNLTKRLESFES